MRPFTFAAFAFLALPFLSSAQSIGPPLEVASVRLDAKQGKGQSRPVSEISLPAIRILPGGRVESYGHTLRNLIAVAYDINMLFQKIEGKQEVLEREFVISAKAVAPTLTSAEAKAMVRVLLEERFQLRWRLRPRDVDGYVLVPAREDGQPGSGLRAFTDDCEIRASGTPAPFTSPEYEQKARCGWTGMLGRQRAVGVSMSAVAERLTALMAGPVSDRTGWKGLFTFDLLADTNDMPFMAVAPRPTGLGGTAKPVDAPQLLEVLRRELGLKLTKGRTTINDFIVEEVQPLIEN